MTSAMLPCLILAGGLGTRIRCVVGERLPKALADVNGKPFLWWMLEWLYHQGVTDVMLSVGHGKDFIKDFLVAHQYPMSIILIEEDEPLGTGGAIAHATKLCEAKQVIVLNGDTLSDVSLRRLGTYFCDTSSDLVLAATRVPDSSRFGALSFDSHSRRLRAFDKRPEAEGFIMAGAYAVNADRVLTRGMPKKFSFEHDWIKTHLDTFDVRVFPEVTRFIDIGIPSDYERAQALVPMMVQVGGRCA